MIFRSLSHCQQWLTQHAGFTLEAGYGWTYRYEAPSTPLVLELRHQGHIVLTLEKGLGFPQVKFPSDYALTYDGQRVRFFRMYPRPELIEQGELEELQFLTAETMAEWPTLKGTRLAA